jgi:hypothetical protein
MGVSGRVYAQSYVRSAVLGINVPTKGGVEDFGGSRPKQCDPSLSHIDSIFQRFEKVSPSAGYLLSDAKTLGKKIAIEVGKDRNEYMKALRTNESQARTVWYNAALETAESYTKLVAGNSSPEQVLSAIRQKSPSIPQDCFKNMKNMGASETLACAATMQLLQVLTWTELFHLQICLVEGGSMQLPVQANVNQSGRVSNSASGSTTDVVPQASNKPSASAQDELVTGPKEDCVALIKSVKPEQMHEVNIACIKRNGSRDRNAANGNTQQPAAETQQRADQAAKQQSNQAQQVANQNQAQADHSRQGKRRRHEAENEASHCLSVDVTSAGFGGFVNTCNFKVAYNFCNFNPKKDSWAEFHTCGKSGAADFVGAGRTSAAHVKNTETVYFFGCKDPAWPVDAEYIPGRGISARCRTVGGN